MRGDTPAGRDGADPAAPRERAFNLPMGVALVVASILGGYLIQSASPDPDAVVRALGLVPADVARGRVWKLATVVLVHGGWAHAGLNALGTLAFGAPVARRLGTVPAFLLFYVLCGVLASLGYVAVHWDEAVALVGASGAISGLMGAASRLLGVRTGAPGESLRAPPLAPFASRQVIGMAAAWAFINLLMAMGWIDMGTGPAPIAWEAHLFGYAAGLFLIAPAERLARGTIRV